MPEAVRLPMTPVIALTIGAALSLKGDTLTLASDACPWRWGDRYSIALELVVSFVCLSMHTSPVNCSDSPMGQLVGVAALNGLKCTRQAAWFRTGGLA